MTWQNSDAGQMMLPARNILIFNSCLFGNQGARLQAIYEENINIPADIHWYVHTLDYSSMHFRGVTKAAELIK